MLKELNYIVNGQTLTGESFKMASDTVNEIKVSFAFEGTDWSGLDSIKAVFSNNRVADSYEAVLVNGTCTIPHEVLTEKGTVSVNLYGSIITGTTLTTRITSYKSAVVDVLQKVNVSGSNSVVPTPATWQQELSAHTQNTTVHVTAQNKTDWNAKVGEAPSDSKQYARKNGAWSEVEAGSSEAVWGQITGTLSNQTDLNTALGNKADKSDTYTKAQTDSAISNHHDSSKADASTTYTKTEVDSAISGHHDSTKADVGVSYTKAEEDALLDDKADAEDIPTKTSELTNDSGFITQHQSLSAYRTSADQDVIDNTKVDKVEGKGLSKNDFTDTLKDKLDGIEANADVTDNLNVKDALTDSLASAWADADKKACCGTIGAVYDGQYELIEEITLTEDVHSITRNVDTNGIAYNFKKLAVTITVPGQSTLPTNKNLYSEVNGISTGYFGGALSSNQTVSSEECEVIGGFLESKYMSPVAGVGYAMNIAGRTPFIHHSAPYIASYKLAGQVLATLIPSGTVIKIYAIRN